MNIAKNKTYSKYPYNLQKNIVYIQIKFIKSIKIIEKQSHITQLCSNKIWTNKKNRSFSCLILKFAGKTIRMMNQVKSL